METTIKVNGMMCQNCVKHVESALKAIPGIKKAKADLEKGTATFSSKEKIEESILKKAIEDEGYHYAGEIK